MSLRTKCQQEARRRLLVVHAQVQALFEEVELTTGQLQHSQALEIAERWRKRALNEDFEQRLNGQKPDRPLHTLSARLQQSLEQMDFSADAGLVEQVKKDHGLQLDPGSMDWKHLAYQLMQAQLQVCEEVMRRDRTGNREMVFLPVEESPPSENMNQLSAMLKKWESLQPRHQQTINEWRTAVERFINLKGDMDVREITRKDVRDYMEQCRLLPLHLTKAERALPMTEIVQRYRKREVKRMSAATVNKNVNAVKSVLEVALQEEILVKNPAQGLNLCDSPSKVRLPFEPQDLQLFFSRSPVYRFGERKRGCAGEAGYWLPLLALYTGARLEELGQLRLTDIRHSQGIHFLDINCHESGKSLKNPNSARRVPLHPKLIEAGFLLEIERLQRQGATHVFPELSHHTDKCTRGFSKWINRQINACGICDESKVFHSFRHTFKDACREAEIPREIQEALMGHSSGKVGDSYGSGFSLKRLYDEIAKVAYEDFVLPPSPAVLGEGLDEEGESFSRSSTNRWNEAA
ncbi:MAG: site-specific integrase [Verrucomicrobiota bacterium JB022]|nr:site-specific integrase [Verrucomicrobiota bacterium JB022]